MRHQSRHKAAKQCRKHTKTERIALAYHSMLSVCTSPSKARNLKSLQKVARRDD